MRSMAIRVAIVSTLMSAAVLGMASAMSTARTPASPEWCAIFRNGSENCYFMTKAQCAATVSGVGGFCRMSFYPADSKNRF